MVLAFLNKGHIVYFTQSLLTSLTVCSLVTKCGESKYCIRPTPNNNVLREVMIVIIISMLDLIAWYDMTFTVSEIYADLV